MVSFCCDGTSAPHMTSVRCVRVNTKVYETVCVKDKDVFIYVCVCVRVEGIKTSTAPCQDY